MAPSRSDRCWEMDAAFELAVDIVARLSKSGPIQTSYDEKLLLYALFKQATEGGPRSSRPGVLDLLGRAKWDAWKKREGLSAYDAKRGYVETLKKILKGYGDRPEAVDYVRELDQLLSQGDQRDMVISGSIADSDVSSEEERRTYQPPPQLQQRTRQPTQESSQAGGSRSYVSASQGSRSARPAKVTRDRSNRSLRDAAASSDEDAPISPPISSSRDRLPPSISQRQLAMHQQQQQQPRYAPSVPGSVYSATRGGSIGYVQSSLPPSQLGGYNRPPSAGAMARSPYAQPPIGTPGPDIEGLRQKLSALEAFLTQPDVPEDRKRQVEIEIAKTRGYLAVISQRFNATTPTSGITLSELQARQQATIQRMTPGMAPPASNLERALDNIQTSLTALNERLSRLEARPPSPAPTTRLPIMELLNRLLFFLRLREAPRGLQQLTWVNLLAVVRGAVTDFAFVAFFVGLLLSIRRHGISIRALRETWLRVLFIGAGTEAMRLQAVAA